MKKAYNEAWIEALAIRKKARGWVRAGLLTPAQEARIRELFPESFYRANVWVRIALFLFTLLLNGCSTTFVSMFFMPALENTLWGAGLLGMAYGTGFFFLLNLLIRERRLYHSGIDDALLYSAVSAFCGGLFVTFSSVFREEFVAYAAIALPVLVWAAVRYASTVVTLATLLDVYAIAGLLAFRFPAGKLLLPLIGLFLSAGIFLASRSMRRKSGIYWTSCLDVSESLALALGYLSINYFVVREGNALIQGTEGPVPFGILFWILTGIIPLACIFSGIRTRNRILLVAGLLTLLLSVYTFQFYYQPVSYPLFSVIGGLILLSGAIACIRFLRSRQTGFTFEKDGSGEGGIRLEALVVAEQASIPSTQTDTFGGGTFGGGGAGDQY